MDETKPWKHQAARTGAALAKPTSAGQEDPSVWVGLALKHLTKRRCWFDQTAMLISPTKQWNHATNIWISSAKMGKQNNMSSSEDNVRFVQQEYRCFQKHLRYMEILTNRKNVFFFFANWNEVLILSATLFFQKRNGLFLWIISLTKSNWEGPQFKPFHQLSHAHLTVFGWCLLSYNHPVQ